MTALTPAGRELFLELVDLPEPVRAERLARCRAAAPELAAEVAALLDADARAEGFLEPPAIVRSGDVQGDEDAGSGALVGRRIGRYTLGPRIGVGGMGTVYIAEQDRPRRKVALKLLRTSWATPNLRRRFEREAEILGRLRHPGIAEIYEAGTHESELGPIPYFALEYIPEAKSITEWADDAKLDVRARVELLARVCDAVAEAHRHGIVHRDIKPSNVLISGSPAGNGRDGAPKLIDFGIARWLDDPEAAGTIATQLGDLLGTLHYMSPEQFDGAGPGPTAASDVYALGVVAYELVTGRLPYPISRTNAARIAELVRTHVPEPLTRTRVGWRDLDAVVQKALAKSPADRYPDAAELAADLRRAAAGEPVRARRSQRSHRLRAWAWRSRRALPWAAAAGALATALVIARRDASTKTEPTPPAEAVPSEPGDYRHHIVAAERAIGANDLARAKVELGPCDVAERGWEWHRLLAQVDRAVQVVPLGAPAHALMHDPTRGVLVATTDDAVHAWRTTEGRAVPVLAPMWRIELGEEPLASAIDVARGLVYIGAANGLVHRRALTDGRDLGSLGAPGSEVACLTLLGDELVVSRHDHTLDRWDPDTLTRTASVRIDRELTSLVPADTNVLAAWNAWGIDVIDPRAGTTLHRLPASEGVEAMLVDGDTLYVAGWDDRITAIDRRGRGEPRPFDLQPDGLVDLVQPDASTLISAGRDGAIAIWDIPTGRVRERLRGHDFGVEALATGSDARWLASVSLDGTLRTWDLRAPPIDRVLRGAGDKVQALAFDEAGGRVIAGIGAQWGRLENAAVRVWSIGDGKATAMATDHAVTVDAIAVAPGGRTIVTASRDGVVHVRDADDLAVRHVIEGPRRSVRVLVFVDDGATFVGGGEAGTLAWWSTDGRTLGQRDAGVGAIADAVRTRDGLVVGGDRGLATLGLAAESEVHAVEGFTGVTALAALPDGTVVVGHADGTLARIELATAAAQWSAPTFGRAITDVAVSPDGSRIATSSQDYRIRLYDAKTGDYLLTVGAHESVATSVAFSPDGRTIASGGYDRLVRLWHAPTAAATPDAGG